MTLKNVFPETETLPNGLHRPSDTSNHAKLGWLWSGESLPGLGCLDACLGQPDLTLTLLWSCGGVSTPRGLGGRLDKPHLRVKRYCIKLHQNSHPYTASTSPCNMHAHTDTSSNYSSHIMTIAQHPQGRLRSPQEKKCIQSNRKWPQHWSKYKLGWCWSADV